MAQAAMRPHATAALPHVGEDWASWFVDNYRSFRSTLLAHRDGARLHAGLLPAHGDLERIMIKQAFLVESGLPPRLAQMAMLAASRFTVGSVLEQQADDDDRLVEQAVGRLEPTVIDHVSAFEEGLSLIVEGVRGRAESSVTDSVKK